MKPPDILTTEPSHLDTTADLSLLPRLRFRRFRGDSDYAAMVAIQEGRQTWDQVDPLSTREGVLTLAGAQRQAAWTVEPTKNMLFVELDGQVIGYNQIAWWREANNHNATIFLYLGYLLPSWRRLGIDELMLHWGEQRIRALVHELAVAPPCFLASNASETEHETAELLQQQGYTRVRTLVEMVCDDLERIPDVCLPAPFTLRPVAREHRRAIVLGENEAYADEWMASAASEEAIQRFVDDPHVDTSLWQVAWDGEELVGCIQINVARGRAVFDEVFVRPAWRRRGVGTALMVHGLRAIWAHGLRLARLHTNDANLSGARTMYQKVGFRPVKRFGLYRKPLEVRAS
jgi:mycothiol synthase